MIGYIAPIAVGIICIVLGIFNFKGDISTLHSYHTHRVSEQDRLAFGRLVGSGTIIIGVSIVLLGTFMILTELTGIAAFTAVGTALMIVGLCVGLVISFYAMKKYNKGIF